MRVGVIGGTGLYDWGPGEPLEIETRWGSVAATHHRRPRAQLFFVPRHGPRHERPAHRVDARPIIAALRAAHVDYVLAFFNVGGLDPHLRSGTWVLMDDLVDLSHARPRTFHDDEAVHVGLAKPFCPQGRAALLTTGPPRVRDRGTYVTTDGPRFETAAEARLLQASGAHVVGMTAGPEAALAREAGLCYVGVAFVANGPHETAPSAQALQARLARAAPTARSWVDRALARLPSRKSCRCAQGLEEAPIGRGRRRTR